MSVLLSVLLSRVEGLGRRLTPDYILPLIVRLISVSQPSGRRERPSFISGIARSHISASSRRDADMALSPGESHDHLSTET